jgi:hypothetical protein
MQPHFWKDKTMRVSQVYYKDSGPWGCWDDAVKAELDRLKLTAEERKRVTTICLPESMRPKRKNQAEVKSRAYTFGQMPGVEILN